MTHTESGQPVEHILQDLWNLKQGKLISQLSVLLTIPLEQKQESKTKGNNKQNKKSNNRSDLCSSLYTICGYTLLFLLWLLIEFPCRVLVLKPFLSLLVWLIKQQNLLVVQHLVHLWCSLSCKQANSSTTLNICWQRRLSNWRLKFGYWHTYSTTPSSALSSNLGESQQE